MTLAASGGSVTADADDMIFGRVHSRCGSTHQWRLRKPCTTTG
jgi:hypothetical protein